MKNYDTLAKENALLTMEKHQMKVAKDNLQLRINELNNQIHSFKRFKEFVISCVIMALCVTSAVSLILGLVIRPLLAKVF